MPIATSQREPRQVAVDRDQEAADHQRQVGLDRVAAAARRRSASASRHYSWPRWPAAAQTASIEVKDALERGRLPRRRARGARLLPRPAARQAGPGRGAGRRRQDRAGQGALARDRPQADPPAVLRGPRRGQGALRVELPQAAAADPGASRRAEAEPRRRVLGRHLRRGLPAHPAAAGGDRLRRAGRAADRRDRQDRPGVRGDAARGPLRLPDLDPRARRDRGAHAPDRRPHLEQLARADRGAEAPLPLPLARLPRRRARDGDRPPARARARRAARPPAGRGRSTWSASST